MGALGGKALSKETIIEIKEDLKTPKKDAVILPSVEEVNLIKTYLEDSEEN